MGVRATGRQGGGQSVFGCRRKGAVALAAALACLLLGACLAGCKPTDFFTEVIITPYAETVDEDNPDSTKVNSPDAEQESSELSALDWTVESPRAREAQNLVVYSSEPNTALATHHSIFDLAAHFGGIEQSDGVRIVYDADSELDAEANAAASDEEPEESEETATGGEEDEPDAESEAAPDASGGRIADEAATLTSDGWAAVGSGAVSSGAAAAADGAGAAGAGGDKASESAPGAGAAGGDAGEGGGDAGGDAPGPSAGEGETEDDQRGEGESDDKYGGFDGMVPEYNPADQFSEPQHANTLAVLGSDAAVLAQALGGAGAVCATSAWAWEGRDLNGNALSYASFGDVFASELDGVQRLWDGDGSRPEDLGSVDDLVAACGQDGVIVYDQRLGNQNQFFDEDQRRELYAANIQLVPVEMSTVQGMKDAAAAIGDVLSESPCEQDAPAMAEQYCQFIDDMVRAVAATHGGSVAWYWEGAPMTTLYNSCPVGTTSTKLCSIVAVESESGLRLEGGSYGVPVDASGIVLFQRNSDYLRSPLMFWQQVSGAAPLNVTDTSGEAQGLQALWPIEGEIGPARLVGSGNGGAWSRWAASRPRSDSHTMLGIYGSGQRSENGLGSAEMPYLIVCGNASASSQEVKRAVVASMNEYQESGRVRATPYSIFGDPDYEFGVPYVPGTAEISSIGLTNEGENPFLRNAAPLDSDDVVRENPRGLAGEWTEGSMESPLEALWLAELYSKSPAGCNYDASYVNMGSFSVSVGGAQCHDLRSTAVAFYRHFYRYDAEGVYEYIVPDQG